MFLVPAAAATSPAPPCPALPCRDLSNPITSTILSLSPFSSLPTASHPSLLAYRIHYFRITSYSLLYYFPPSSFTLPPPLLYLPYPAFPCPYLSFTSPTYPSKALHCHPVPCTTLPSAAFSNNSHQLIKYFPFTLYYQPFLYIFCLTFFPSIPFSLLSFINLPILPH